MKDSGIEWIGPVPGHWGVGSLRWLATCRSGLSVPTEDFQKDHSDTYHIPVIGSNGSIGFTNRPSINSEIIAVGRVGSCGSVRIVDVPAWVTDNALIIEPTDRLDIRFLSWVLQARNLPELATKTAQPLITGGQILNQKIPYTSLPEQTRIANFLDEQTARIDALIADKERLDALLGEYRSSLISAAVTGQLDPTTGEAPRRAQEGGSGVRGKVSAPRGWMWSKVKYVADFYTGWTPSTGNQDFFHGSNLWANISDLGPKTLYDTAKQISDEAVKQAGINISPAGSVLFSFKLSIGQVSFAGRDMYTNEAIATFPPQSGFNAKWAYWALPVYVPLNADENIYGAKLLNQELIRSAHILVPPPPEQTRIANFLDEQTARIDDLRSHCVEHIMLLREYRSSLISAAVTGQLDIGGFRGAGALVSSGG